MRTNISTNNSDKIRSFASQYELARGQAVIAKAPEDRDYWNAEVAILTQSILEDLHACNRTWFITAGIRYRIDGAGELVREKLLRRYNSTKDKCTPRGKTANGKVRIQGRKACPV